LSGWMNSYKLTLMNNIIKSVVYCLVALIPVFSTAQESYKPMAEVEAFKNKLTAMSKSTGSIVSDFVQEKNLSVLTSKIISKGQFFFKKDNNIRWEYNEPYKYLIVISNGKLFTKDDKNQKQYDIQSNKMFQEMNKFITGCIQGDILKNDKDYKIEYYESGKAYFVKLIPYAEKMKQMLNEVQIYFDKNDLTVSRIKMIESGEDYTRIDFINKKLNTEIPLEKFSFK
jgi:outer membrane lipoprotein-sorting protein